jgi:flagellar motor switch protein FliN/FliY
VDNPITAQDINNNYRLIEAEEDALGEIGNICMGTAATTLSTLLGKSVRITTPLVSICRSIKDLGHYQKPFVAAEVSYTQGVDGYNILLMKEEDVRVIANILLDGDAKADAQSEIEDIHLSAISEVMNQMVGSASTCLSDILHKPIHILPPNIARIVMQEDDAESLVFQDDIVVKISFQMEIEGVLKSELMQIMPYDFSKELAATLLENTMQEETVSPNAQPMSGAKDSLGKPSLAPAKPSAKTQAADQMPVSVRRPNYQSFDEEKTSAAPIEGADNINLIMDVPLRVTVELGNCKKSIKDILALNMGSIIVLDRLAGEMVDIMVNGKLFAKGEVVVIDDSYGVRVTDIVAMPQV